MANQESSSASHKNSRSSLRFDAKTRIRLRALAGGAADSALNVLILFAFAYVGTISLDVPVKILLIAAIFNFLFFGLIASGLTLRCADPAITWAQIFAACGANAVALLMAPQISYMFLINLFVSLSFGSLYFNRRQFVVAWVLLSMALGVVIYWVGDTVGIAHSLTVERYLFWIVLTLALGRFMLINAEISRLRARLQEKNRALAAASEKLIDLATHDELTSLWNRRQFMVRLEDETGRAGRNGAAFSVAVMDVDFFKHINDRLGHLTGDAVLRELAAVLNATRRGSDVLARYGGEEFTVLLLDSSSESAVNGIERMRRNVEQHDWTHISPDLKVTVSAGVATRGANETATQVLKRADKALYLAKESGRNCIRLLALPVESAITC